MRIRETHDEAREKIRSLKLALYEAQDKMSIAEGSYFLDDQKSVSIHISSSISLLESVVRGLAQQLVHLPILENHTEGE